MLAVQSRKLYFSYICQLREKEKALSTWFKKYRQKYKMISAKKKIRRKQTSRVSKYQYTTKQLKAQNPHQLFRVTWYTHEVGNSKVYSVLKCQVILNVGNIFLLCDTWSCTFFFIFVSILTFPVEWCHVLSQFLTLAK